MSIPDNIGQGSTRSRGSKSELTLVLLSVLILQFGGAGLRAQGGATLTTLYSFTCGSDGSAPNGLLLGADGNLYGTTYYGADGTGGCCGKGYGTLFKLTPQGALTTLHTFAGPNTDEGNENNGGVLLQGTNLNLYGITASGGAYAHGGQSG